MRAEEILFIALYKSKVTESILVTLELKMPHWEEGIEILSWFYKFSSLRGWNKLGITYKSIDRLFYSGNVIPYFFYQERYYNYEKRLIRLINSDNDKGPHSTREGLIRVARKFITCNEIEGKLDILKILLSVD